MRRVRSSLAIVLALLLVAPPAQAQNHVIDRAALDQALRDRVNGERADRDAILSLLHRRDVKDLAARAGLSIEQAEAGVYMLHGDGLQSVAAEARQVQQDLAGGGNVTISTTTIIIILLVVILIVVIAD